MKALILVKRLRLRHVLVRLPHLLSTFPLHKEFKAAVIQLPGITNLLYLPLFLLANRRSLGRTPETDRTIAEPRFERGWRP